MIFGKKVGAKDTEKTVPSGGRFGIGQCFEGAVARYLTEQGYELLFRNYRVRGGEIDLIMKKDDILAFIEVKAREESVNLQKYGRPSDAVDYRKRAHIITAADDYLKSHPSIGRPRIDVVEVYYSRYGEFILMRFKHIPNAFGRR